MLSKGGYFNENVLTFRIEDGKTTTLDVRPVIRPASGALLKVRTEKSIAWDEYNGDLKFKK